MLKIAPRSLPLESSTQFNATASPDSPGEPFDGPASAAKVTPFTGRLFGCRSTLSGLIRLYAAYNNHGKHLYFLALCTYLIVFSHFTAELLAYGTMKIGKGLAPPLFVATTSVIWMLTQWSFYVEWFS